MNEQTVAKRMLGVTFNSTGEAEITAWAPEATQLELVLPGGATIAMRKGRRGYWLLTTPQLRPGDRYWFLLDGRRLPDPASLSQPDGVHGPSQGKDLQDFDWHDDSWKNPPLQEYIIYELHTGTFTPDGTFAAIEEKLDYLVSLGITAIELMPVAHFPGDRNWGYDGVFPFAVHQAYGGAGDLQHLVDACHAKGLAVILDVVYNHLGPEGNYLSGFAPYFTAKYGTPWGEALNFDDAYSDEVRRYFTENVLMWFRDFHIDALRLDAVHAIRDFGPRHLLAEMKQQVNEWMKISGKAHYLIVECDLNDPCYIDGLQKGYGMDAQWTDEFHHALRVAAGQEPYGYYADFNGIGHLAKAYRDVYVYDGQYSEERKKTFGLPVKEHPGHKFIVFSQNHDQIGNRMLGERTSTLVSFGMQKLLAGAVMVSPFIPLLFMGEEWGETNPFQYFVSHTDPEIAEAVRKGRKEEFAHFYISGEAPDPMAIETFLNSKLQWKLLQQYHNRLMISYYQHLIHLRKTQPVLCAMRRDQLEASGDEARRLLFLHRWETGQHLYCILNFGPQPQTVALPAGHSFTLLLDSAAPAWGGDHTSALPVNGEAAVAPESITVYACADV